MYKLQQTIIALHGRKQAGKSTVVNYLKEKYSFNVVNFADRLKEFCNNVFGFIDKSEAAKETFVTCLVKEDELYKEIRLLGVHQDDVDEIAHWFNAVFRPWEEDQCDVGWHYQVSPRVAYQLCGTEIFREYSESFWLDRIAIANKTAIGDLRFSNEAEWVKQKGGRIWKIVRPDMENSDSHISERGISPELVDETIWNNGTLEHLYKQIDELMEKE